MTTEKLLQEAISKPRLLQAIASIEPPDEAGVNARRYAAVVKTLIQAMPTIEVVNSEADRDKTQKGKNKSDFRREYKKCDE